MGRLTEDLLSRIEAFCDRVLDVCVRLEQARVSWRIVDQLTGCGTAVGANAFEADEALSRADFCKIIGISIKELNEARFWLRLVERRGMVASGQTEPLQAELAELKKILGSILSRSRESMAKLGR
ncbi:MAG TPA: four helix bundle protein [Phycisphaerales bacterium]|nr:four helix bundle protein [Phycisphaerales bacterium]